MAPQFRVRGVGGMTTENVILAMLGAIIALSYLIANRLRRLQHDVECMHDFVHWFGELIDERNPLVIKEPTTPSPFKETSRTELMNDVQKWDEGH